MKTITIDFDIYELELDDSYKKGRDHAFRDVMNYISGYKEPLILSANINKQVQFIIDYVERKHEAEVLPLLQE